MASPSECDRELIARRELTNVRTGGLHTISIFRPRREGEREEGPDWECKVEVHEAEEVRTEYGRGVDSLQALTNAHALLFRRFGPDFQNLRWLGDAGNVGIPFLVTHADPDFLQMVEHLVIAESCRMSVVRRSLESLIDRRYGDEDADVDDD